MGHSFSLRCGKFGHLKCLYEHYPFDATLTYGAPLRTPLPEEVSVAYALARHKGRRATLWPAGRG
jgi:hypothetical protein